MQVTKWFFQNSTLQFDIEYWICFQNVFWEMQDTLSDCLLINSTSLNEITITLDAKKIINNPH